MWLHEKTILVKIAVIQIEIIFLREKKGQLLSFTLNSNELHLKQCYTVFYQTWLNPVSAPVAFSSAGCVAMLGSRTLSWFQVTGSQQGWAWKVPLEVQHPGWGSQSWMPRAVCLQLWMSLRGYGYLHNLWGLHHQQLALGYQHRTNTQLDGHCCKIEMDLLMNFFPPLNYKLLLP